MSPFRYIGVFFSSICLASVGVNYLLIKTKNFLLTQPTSCMPDRVKYSASENTETTSILVHQDSISAAKLVYQQASLRLYFRVQGHEKRLKVTKMA